VAYRQALVLVATEPDRAHLRRRLAAVAGPDGTAGA
jgi:hypothetical protein